MKKMATLICESLRQYSCLEVQADHLSYSYFDIRFKEISLENIEGKIKEHLIFSQTKKQKEEYENIRNHCAYLLINRGFQNRDIVEKSVKSSLSTINNLIEKYLISYKEAMTILQVISKQMRYESNFSAYLESLNKGDNDDEK